MIYKWYQFVERVNEAEIAVNPPTTGAEIVSGQTPTTSTATQSTTSSSVQNDKNSTTTANTSKEIDTKREYTRRGDPYTYKVSDKGHWLAKKQQHKRWYEISGLDKKPGYEVSIDILDNEFPDARPSGAPMKKPKTQVPVETKPDPPKNPDATKPEPQKNPDATKSGTGGQTTVTPETTLPPAPAITEDPSQPAKQMSELEKKGSAIYDRLKKNGRLFFRSGTNSNVMVYKGPDLSEDEKTALIAYMRYIDFRMSRYNNDFRKGDKLIFKRGLEESEVEKKASGSKEADKKEADKKEVKLSQYFDRPDDSAAVDEKILELFRKNIIDFKKRDDRNEKGIRKIDIAVKSIPLGEVDIKVFSKYFGECNFEAFPKISDQKQQQIKLGYDEHTYKYISEKDSTEIKQNNTLSVFLHYYFEGGMKKRLLSKNFKYRGKQLDDVTKNKLEEFVQALNYKEKVKFKEEKTNDSYIFGYQEFVNKNIL